MAKYKLLEDGTYKNNETGQFGIGPGVWLYEELQQWLAAGGIPDPVKTQAEIDQEAIDLLQNNRLETLKAATIDQFKMLLALFQVGKTNGVWVNNDFDANLRAKAAAWLQLIADYEAGV